MKKETEAIAQDLQQVLAGQPWYGKCFSELLNEVGEEKFYSKPNTASHSVADLLYHMITWADFTRYRLEKKPQDMQEVEAMDWREINPAEHSLEKGMRQFAACIYSIIELLKAKDDQLLEEKVDYREYNFRYLLNGLVQHTIYHLGQIAYVNKLLS
ncbi:MAG: DinB family protein [Williamsia sp.]|nr:DinB family protein [Williamsia sp.]